MGTYIVGGLLVVAVAGALAKMRKDKKNSACGGGCSSCGCGSKTEQGCSAEK